MTCKFADESNVLEVKNGLETSGFSLEEIVIELSSINNAFNIFKLESDDTLKLSISDKVIELIKEAHAKLKPHMHKVMDVMHGELERDKKNNLWRNGFVGALMRENDQVRRSSMLIVFHAFCYYDATERALVTKNSSDFLIAIKHSSAFLKVLRSSAALLLAKISLMDKEDRKRRGKKAMLEVSSGNAKRDEKIKAAYAQFVTDGRQREAAGILASRFNLDSRQIRRIVNKADTGLPMSV